MIAYDRPLRTVGVALALLVLAALLTTKLTVRSDLVELLPRSFRSVLDLSAVQDDFGAFGRLAVVAEGAEPEVLVQFAEDVAHRLRHSDLIRYVGVRRPWSHMRDRAAYFVDLADLRAIRDRVDDRYGPDSLRFGGPERLVSWLSELGGKYRARLGEVDAGPVADEYYLDSASRRIAVFLKPNGRSSDLTFTRAVVEEVRRLVASLKPASSDPALRVYLGGTFAKKIEGQEAIGRDLRRATVLALVMVLAFLALHLRRAVSVALLFLPLLAGIVWTLGFAGAVFGTVNVLTAFVGAILAGLGIDHGIHLLQRLAEEMATQTDPRQAVRRTFAETGRATWVAGVTTAAAFAAISISEFRAFREFGVIASVGMVVTLSAYTVLLPALIRLAVSRGWHPRAGRGGGSRFAKWLSSHARGVLLACGLIVSALAIIGSDVEVRYDTRTLADLDSPAFVLDSSLDSLLGHPQAPVVIRSHGVSEETATVEAIRRHRDRVGPSSMIGAVRARVDLLPDDMEEKWEILAEIREILADVDSDLLPADRDLVDRLTRFATAEPFSAEQLPAAVLRELGCDPDHPDQGFVLVFPAHAVDEGNNALRLGRELRSIRLPHGDQPLRFAGEAMVMADFQEMVEREWPMVLVLALILVVAVLAIGAQRWTDIGLSLLPAGATVAGVLGLVRISPLELNALSIIMVPILFGGAVDGALHLTARWRQGASIAVVVDTAGRAVAAAIATSALGFGALLFADHGGLRSLGLFAVLGMALNLLACLVMLPALLAWLERKHSSAGTDRAGIDTEQGWQ